MEEMKKFIETIMKKSADNIELSQGEVKLFETAMRVQSQTESVETRVEERKKELENLKEENDLNFLHYAQERLFKMGSADSHRTELLMAAFMIETFILKRQREDAHNKLMMQMYEKKGPSWVNYTTICGNLSPASPSSSWWLPILSTTA